MTTRRRDGIGPPPRVHRPVIPHRYHCTVTVMLTVVTSWMGLSVLLGLLLAAMIRTEEARSDGYRRPGSSPEPARPERRRTEQGARASAH